MPQSYDIAILGGGIGGYSAAITAAKQGKQVIIIEQSALGGTCLHKGCIPSKALLKSAQRFSEIKSGEFFGITVQDAKLDFGRVQKRKEQVVQQLHQGLSYWIKQKKIEVVYGKGRIIGPSIFSPKSGTIAVELPGGEISQILGKYVIIATGSKPRTPSEFEIDGKRFLHSDHALTLQQLPHKLLIVGGGVIGVEWASMMSDFGVEVTLIEEQSRILFSEDEEISEALHKSLSERGVCIHTQTKISIIDNKVRFSNHTDTVEWEEDPVLFCVGRRANTDEIGIENTGIKTRANGAIVVNKYMQTEEPHIYAVGDCIDSLQLAHVAGFEGVTAARHILGLSVDLTPYSYIPKCIYTRPGIASIGYTEQKLKEEKIPYLMKKLPFSSLGKALIDGEHGFVKMLVHKQTEDILGVHWFGGPATDLIAEAGLAMNLNATGLEVARSIHPHPTFSELFQEAGLSLINESVHF